MTTPSDDATAAGLPRPATPGTGPQPSAPGGYAPGSLPAAPGPYAAVPAGHMQGWVPPPAPADHASHGRPLAGFGSRLGAYLIDVLIVAAVSMAIFVPLAVAGVFAVAALTPADADSDAGALAAFLLVLALQAVIVLLLLGVYYLYFVEYQLRHAGQTVGKRALSIAVVPFDTGTALTRRALTMRWLVQYAAGAVVPLLVYLDGLWQLWDKPWQQCLHDKAARTLVVVVG